MPSYRDLFDVEKFRPGCNVQQRGEVCEAHADLVKRLNDYENEFIRRADLNPDALENLLDTYALHAAGLTQAGLIKARFLAGKRPSMKPGIHCLESVTL